MIRLYTVSGSPYGWRVQLALAYKQIAHDVRWLSIAKDELKDPAYLALNPRGRVPTLVDGDVVVYESLAILAYIEAAHPEPRLLGTTPAATARIWRVISEHTAYLDPAVETFILPLYFGSTDGKLDALNTAAQTIHDELARFADQLTRTRYLAGDELTLADLVVLPHVQSILRAASKPAATALTLPFQPLAQPLADWKARLEALPYYPDTVPPHWRS
jgi:glutathione S-transferase